MAPIGGDADCGQTIMVQSQDDWLDWYKALVFYSYDASSEDEHCESLEEMRDFVWDNLDKLTQDRANLWVVDKGLT
jgi:hypothetical protein